MIREKTRFNPPYFLVSEPLRIQYVYCIVCVCAYACLLIFVFSTKQQATYLNHQRLKLKENLGM